ncbi:MAG: ABC transporter ATP-binding protein [Thermomicrobiales bacterium]
MIRTADLTKRFGSFTALNQIDLSIPRGAIGLLGPNGAGKTTLIRLLLGLSRPTSGSAEVLGFDAFSQGIQVRERVGYMPEAECLPSNATAADFVGHMAEMSGLPKTEARQRAADVLYQVGLDEERYRLIKGFSTGMKQRVKLAQSIVHDPQIVFLDEPTAGLDPPGRDSMLELVERIHRMMGMTVVLSSHILEDIERVCDYVVIINSGQLALAQSIGGGPVDGAQLSIQIDGNAEQFIQRLEALGIDDARLRDRMTGLPEIVIRQPSDKAYDAVRDTAVELDVPLISMTGKTRSLEDLYLQAVGAAALDSDLHGGV